MNTGQVWVWGAAHVDLDHAMQALPLDRCRRWQVIPLAVPLEVGAQHRKGLVEPRGLGGDVGGVAAPRGFAAGADHRTWRVRHGQRVRRVLSWGGSSGR